jgi:hypothetical protein
VVLVSPLNVSGSLTIGCELYLNGDNISVASVTILNNFALTPYESNSGSLNGTTSMRVGPDVRELGGTVRLDSRTARYVYLPTEVWTFTDSTEIIGGHLYVGSSATLRFAGSALIERLQLQTGPSQLIPSTVAGKTLTVHRLVLPPLPTGLPVPVPWSGASVSIGIGLVRPLSSYPSISLLLTSDGFVLPANVRYDSGLPYSVPVIPDSRLNGVVAKWGYYLTASGSTVLVRGNGTVYLAFSEGASGSIFFGDEIVKDGVLVYYSKDQGSSVVVARDNISKYADAVEIFDTEPRSLLSLPDRDPPSDINLGAIVGGVVGGVAGVVIIAGLVFWAYKSQVLCFNPATKVQP